MIEIQCIPIPNLTDSDIKRFWSKVNKSKECWEWTGTKNGKGYGSFRFSNKRHPNIQAHRISYKIHNNRLPSNRLVCHTCDRPPCQNPKHLFLGTRIDNINDMFEKNRGNPAFQRHKICLKGLHKLEGNNLYIKPSGDRACRACIMAYEVIYSPIRKRKYYASR